MINEKAYKEWKDLFNENVSDVWQEESMPVLRKLSMLLFSIKKEIKNIEDKVAKDVLNLKKMVTEAPKKQDILESPSTEITNNKENIQLKKTVINFSLSKDLSENITVDSPEMFQNVEPPILKPNDSAGSIIISDDDTVNTFTNESPEIKKKKRSHASQKRIQRWDRLKDGNTSTISLLQGLKTRLDSGSGSQLTIQNNDGKREQTSVIDDKSSMDFFRGLIGHTQFPLDPIKENEIKNKKDNLLLTPVRSDCDVDLSVVQCTPMQVSLPKRKDKTSSYLSKKRSKRENTTTTLTQLFSRNENRKYEDNSSRSRLQGTNYDSDETYFDVAQGTKTSQAGSVMGITRMVSYLNTESQLKEQDVTQPKRVSQGIINLDPDTQEIAEFVEDIRYEDFEDDNNVSLNSAIVEENEMEEDVPEKLNDFLAKAQNVPKYQLEAEPVVRGKARNKLPSWSCKDCEKFYLNQGLNPEEILALNKCSRHRGHYRPREDTLPGFWDMNMVTQESKNTK